MEPSLGKKNLKDWTDEERITAVKNIFNAITPKYDLLNRVMSGRQDVRWRRFAASRVPESARSVMDLAVGTGDLALDIAAARPDATIFGVDFVESMMRVAVSKTRDQGLLQRITYTGGDALRLPFRDDCFDAATIAFGLRNIPDRSRALSEMTRVVRPGGRVLLLEMTFPKHTRLKQFFKWYLNMIVPTLGSLISGNSAAYRYLPDSIQDFMEPDELSRLCEGAGLLDVIATPLTFGLTYLHEGTVP
jgi:demethylmenaquinone methyltransferase/2-methoxy-6-polyprenyl-1,4-benzoquinol methylase